MGRATKDASRTRLTDRQEVFCRQYLANGCNATKAAVDSGYSKKNADKIGPRLVGKCRAVQVRIDELRAPKLAKLDITADRVLNEIAAIAFARATDVMQWGPMGVSLLDSAGLTPEQAAAVSKARQTVNAEGGSIALEMHDKLGALEKLGRYLKLWGDKPGITTPWDEALKGMTEEQMIERAEALRAARLRAQAAENGDT